MENQASYIQQAGRADRRDYSLLRPFDLEKAKAGEAVCNAACESRKFIAGPDRLGRICLEGDGEIFVVAPSVYYMAPLCWVEGRPVYKGDRLWHRGVNDWITVTEMENHPGEEAVLAEGSTLGYMTYALTWKEPNPVLFELDGRPVFKGTKLAKRVNVTPVEYHEVVVKRLKDDSKYVEFENGWVEYTDNRDGDLTWEMPLCVVENKGVFVGDELFHRKVGKIKATGPHPYGHNGCAFSHAKDDHSWGIVELMTWTPPIVKREGWVNVYSEATASGATRTSFAHQTKEAADASGMGDRIACVRIEWEEPAK